MLGIMDVFSTQLAAKPERKQPMNLKQKAKRKKNGCNV